jgi:hypothetical protein
MIHVFSPPIAFHNRDGMEGMVPKKRKIGALKVGGGFEDLAPELLSTLVGFLSDRDQLPLSACCR